MKRAKWSDLSDVERRDWLARPSRRADRAVVDAVRRIFDDVEANGEDAVRRWSLKFDGAAPRQIVLDSKRVDEARARLQSDDLDALEVALENVRLYHIATMPGPVMVQVRPGVACRREWRPIGSCGLYAPGGTAPLFSTLIMLAEPARIAGVATRIAVTPPHRERDLHPMMIATAAACGLESLWAVGGAQAIAALTFGAGLPRAEKICGPGNAYVAEAKRYAASLPNGPLIDLPAGPSELLVIADDGARAGIVAADLLGQAEHGEDAQVLLVSTSERLVDKVLSELAEQTATLPRADIIAVALEHARIIEAADIDEAIGIANLYAPEHLSLQIKDADARVSEIDNAGAIFVGEATGETFGDYLSGPSHVLPTDGAARLWSGVGVDSFLKAVAVQSLTPAAAKTLAGPAARLARLEGLEAHARAAEGRG